MPPTLPEVFAHLLAAKYFQLAPFVVLVYEHMLTFGEEVERIWKQKFTGASFLFLVNRYGTLLQFIVIIVAFQDPQWTGLACSRFVAFEGSTTIALIAVCELIMILRIYALYRRSNRILLFLGTLWIAQITISSIGISNGFALPLPPGFVGCIFTGKKAIFPAIWVSPVVTDGVMFLLTLNRSREFLKKSGTAPTLYIFVRDGTIYFLIICIANLLNILIYFLAEVDLKPIGASFSQLATSVMISRLVLNLRSGKDNPEPYGSAPAMKFMTRTIGNLGEEMTTFLDPPSLSSTLTGNRSSQTHVEEIPMIDMHITKPNN